MSDLVAFLNARLDEDEAAAKRNLGWMRFEAKPGDWTRLMCDPVMGPFGGQSGTRDVAVGLYVGEMSDPARVLREVEAKRKILALHATSVSKRETYAFDPSTGEAIPETFDVECAVCGWASDTPGSACPTLRALAAVYAGQPDYDKDWA